MGRRILNDALQKMLNAERRGNASTTLQPISGTIIAFLNVMKSRGSLSLSLLLLVFSLHFLLNAVNCSCKRELFVFLSMKKLLKSFRKLQLIASGYIKDFQVFDPHRVGRISVELFGRLKDCKALSYRQDIKAKDIEKYRIRMLPTRQWGYVVITTPNGVLDHEDAIKQNVGGQVLGFFH
ncbi:hypothetical protein ZIOFF_043889 [Zingiber officinale]|uniref:Small ribosomal subunit protein uS8c n=1 Tax=Zingiber officinale TaxID=94328 RepID=A0A8J5FXF1_ZINOF|nr:hypothetical protein ZIOFF_043889 [Zingiber officinale]